MAKILDMKNNDNYEDIKEAGKVISDGGLVLFPTETVYGLGADGLNAEAVKNIFIAKGRKQDNPLILHVSDMDMVTRIAKNISEMEYELMDAFWPGPFTIVLDRKDIVPDTVTGGLDTVGIRMPSNIIANRLIKYANTPIAAPSANISGKPSGTNIKDIFDELGDKVDYIIDGGDSQVGLESTVVRVINNIPTILRPGRITAEQIKDICGVVKVDDNVLHKLDSDKPVLSPGMKYKHYAPNSKCVLVYSEDNNKLVDKMNEIASEYNNSLIICTNENEKKVKANTVITIGKKNDLDEIGRNVFSYLRKVDNYNPDIVIIEGVSEKGFGLAIMNRLIRACSHNYIEV